MWQGVLDFKKCNIILRNVVSFYVGVIRGDQCLAGVCRSFGCEVDLDCYWSFYIKNKDIGNMFFNGSATFCILAICHMVQIH